MFLQCNVVMLCIHIHILLLGVFILSSLYPVIKIFKKTTSPKSHNSILQVCNAVSDCGWNLHNKHSRKMKKQNVTIYLAS